MTTQSHTAIAWLRDAHGGEGDECLVPAAQGDPGAFPVYAHPPCTGELLLACQAFMSWWDDMDGTPAGFDELARAAIAKATGEAGT